MTVREVVGVLRFEERASRSATEYQTKHYTNLNRKKEEQMEDWRNDNLRGDLKSLRKEVREVERRTYRVENWQSLLPMRVMMGVAWLVAAGTVVFAIARVASGSE